MSSFCYTSLLTSKNVLKVKTRKTRQEIELGADEIFSKQSTIKSIT